MPEALHILFWIVGGFFLAQSALWLAGLLSLRRLPRASELPQGAAPARLSVIVAGRDEAARIETTMRRLLAQTGVEIELIAVDDRSVDGTGEILDRLAAEDARLRVVHITALPDRWLGKCHACHAGASLASGDWLLFTDADVWLAEDAAARGVACAERDGAGHLCLLPAMHKCSFSGRVALLAAMLSGLRHVLIVNRDLGKAAIGVGAFNLVRADVYRACGGYEALRLEVVDDVKLGLLAQRAGARTRVYFGADDAQCEWASSARDVVRVMEKNFFAILGFRVWLVAFILLAGGGSLLVAAAGPFTGTAAGWFAFAGLWSMTPLAWRLARLHGWPGWSALATPLGFVTLLAAMAHSAFWTLRAGGVRWRGTLYPLRELRAGRVR